MADAAATDGYAAFDLLATLVALVRADGKVLHANAARIYGFPERP